MQKNEQIEFQRRYYTETAAGYSQKHTASENDEHNRALRQLFAWIPSLDVRSILDIGAGTGRVFREAAAAGAGVEVFGIEPVVALREQGHAEGIPPERLVDGDATALSFGDDSFDIVAECGVLHHIPNDEKAVAEMCRVARVGVFISDCNNVAQGPPVIRLIKRISRGLGVWPAIDFIKNGGKRYIVSEGDGLAYSYSIFDSLRIVRRKFPAVYYLGVRAESSNLLTSAPQIAVLCLKR